MSHLCMYHSQLCLIRQYYQGCDYIVATMLQPCDNFGNGLIVEVDCKLFPYSFITYQFDVHAQPSPI